MIQRSEVEVFKSSIVKWTKYGLISKLAPTGVWRGEAGLSSPPSRRSTAAARLLIIRLIVLIFITISVLISSNKNSYEIVSTSVVLRNIICFLTCEWTLLVHKRPRRRWIRTIHLVSMFFSQRAKLFCSSRIGCYEKTRDPARSSFRHCCLHQYLPRSQIKDLFLLKNPVHECNLDKY